jgi:hypothetical protein
LGEIPAYMNIAAGIILGVCAFLTAVLIIALFVWAAHKDGQEDRALQARLGSASGVGRDWGARLTLCSDVRSGI